MKANKGISMITLAVTVLIMIILAGIIVMAVADGGLIDKASNTVTGYNDREQKESDILDKIEDEINNELGGTSGNTGNAGNGGTNVPETPSTPTPEPQPQILKDVIVSANYGDTVNYSANGVTDWKVFYNDGTNVFIIAADYLESAKLPTGALIGTHTDYKYSAYWPSGGVYLNGLTGASDIDASVANKYMLGWLTKYPTSTNTNIKAISTLMNQDVWDAFVTAPYAESAIASPTLEMFASSWNQKYPTGAQIYYDVTSDVGYYVTTIAPSARTGEITTTFTSLSGETGYSDTLYFPHTSSYEKCNGYWLSSPSTYTYNNNQSPQYVYCTGFIGGSQDGCCGSGSQATATADFTLRPVVCLSAAVKGLKTNGVWELSN